METTKNGIVVSSGSQSQRSRSSNTTSLEWFYQCV